MQLLAVRAFGSALVIVHHPPVVAADVIASKAGSCRLMLVRLLRSDSSPPSTGAVEDVFVVQHRMDDRNLLLIVDAGEAVEIDRAQVEEAALAAALQIGLRRDVVGRRPQQVRRREFVEPVVLVIALVGDDGAIPAVDPAVVDPELAGRVDVAAPRPITRRAAERIRIELEDSRGPDRVRAVHQPMTPLALNQRTLLGGEFGREREVVVRRQRPIVRGGQRHAIPRACSPCRDEETGLALGGRVGR